MATLINQFKVVKIYQVNASSSQIKKYDLKSLNGEVEIHMDNDQVLVQLISKIGPFDGAIDDDDDLVATQQIFLNTKLTNLELNFINSIRQINTNCFINRIEFKPATAKSTETDEILVNGCYYAIEFFEKETYKQFEECIKYLNEIYAEHKLSNSCNEEDFEMTDSIESTGVSSTKVLVKKENVSSEFSELCDKLSLSIQEGNVESACLYARLLAEAKAVIRLSPAMAKEIGSQMEAEPNETESRVIVLLKSLFNNKSTRELNLSNGLEIKIENKKVYSVVDLKNEICKHFKIASEHQLIVINDFAVTDDVGPIDSYSTIQSRRTSSASQIDEDLGPMTSSASLFDNFDFIVHVFDGSSVNGKRRLSSTANNFNEDSESEQNENESEFLTFFTSKKTKQTKKELEDKFHEYAAFYNLDLNENIERFNCAICLEDDIDPGNGCILKECLHVFCKECLRGHINSSDDPIIKCPYNKDYSCLYTLQDREIRGLLMKKNGDDYKKYQMKCLSKSEAIMQNVFHCKTPDCIGFCIFEDNLNFFDCPVCEKVNCLRCNIIHMGKTCREYQDDLKIADVNDKNAQKNKLALEELIAKKKAMHCPGCKIILCKQEGCDWLQCVMCKMEICWAIRGPRWGPGGKGDTSGGCKCNYVGGKPCIRG